MQNQEIQNKISLEKLKKILTSLEILETEFRKLGIITGEISENE